MMKSIMGGRSPHDSSSSSFSFSKRYFNCTTTNHDNNNNNNNNEDNNNDIPSSEYSSPYNPISDQPDNIDRRINMISCIFPKLASLFNSPPPSVCPPLGNKVVGTLFGHRRGHVHVSFQDTATSAPAFLIELSTPTSVLVKEMASGLVKVALECDKVTCRWDENNNNNSNNNDNKNNNKKKNKKSKKKKKLLEEPLWRAYCNGKKCGYAMRRECGAPEWRVLRSVGPISMGAGVLPGYGPPEVAEVAEEGEVMYMRARFERVVGSKDCEAFYMISPDGSAGPELSVYLLRV